MNIAFVSTEISAKNFEPKESPNFNFIIKKNLNELSSSFLQSNQIQLLVITHFEPISSGLVLLIRQFNCLYPHIQVILLHKDQEAKRLFIDIQNLYLLMVAEETDTKQLVRRMKTYIETLSSDSRLPVISYKNLSLDPNTREVLMDLQKIDLQRTEFNLLELFLTYPKRIFTKAELLELVWNYQFETGSRTVEVHIAKLRNKLAKHSHKKFFKTVYGKGYRLA